MRRSTATRWENWRARGARFAAPAAGSSTPPGTPILQTQFGTRLYLAVEIAWGAVLNAGSGSWTWTDVTGDVQVETTKALTISVGRQDEASQSSPAACSFTLDNRGNKYTDSPLGGNWPNVKRSTPLRIRVFLDGVPSTLYQGYVTLLQPEWDVTGQYAIVNVTANGLLQRMGQGNVPTQSACRMGIPTNAGLVAYWPMEDQSIVTGFAPAFPGALEFGVSGTPQLNQFASFPGSDSLPELDGSHVFGWVPAYAYTGTVQLRFLIGWPATGSTMPDATSVASLWVFGSPITRWDIQYKTGGGIVIAGYDGANSLQYVSSVTAFALDGQFGRLSFGITQSGSDTSIQWSWLRCGGPTPTTFTDTKLGCITVGAQAVELNRGGTSTTTVAIGHVEVSSQWLDLVAIGGQPAGFDGETGDTRMTRVLGYQGVDAPAVVGDVSVVGVQQADNPLNLLREVEATDHGMLADGLGPSALYFGRHYLENRTTSMTIDVTSGALAAQLEPKDDDQLLRNSWTATQRGGASYTYTDTTSALSAPLVGLLGDSVTINSTSTAVAAGIRNAAGWRVHESAMAGYRYPQLQFAFHHNPELLQQWLAAGLQARIDLTNVSSYVAQMPAAPVSVAVQGYSYSINRFLWSATLNCAVADAWRVAVTGQPAGDTGEFLFRVDTDGSQLAADAPAGATSLLVARATTTTALWTVAVDDFPMVISVGGLPVTVTAISSITSPQTFTVDPATVTKPLGTGTSVSLWKPPVLSM